MAEHGESKRETIARMWGGYGRGARMPLSRLNEGGDDVVGPDGTEYDSEAHALYEGVMGLCGCGRPEKVSAFLIAALKTFEPMPGNDTPAIQCIAALIAADPDTAAEFIAHVLESREMIEEGFSVFSATLTERGKQMIAAGPLPY